MAPTRPQPSFVLAMAVVLSLGTLILAQTAEYEPPRRAGGDVPQPRINAMGWIEAAVDVEVGASGAIVKTTGLRATPDGLAFLLPSLKNWRFDPAVDAKKKPVGSHVLVVAMMRPAQLFDPAGGSPPADLAKPGADVPYPASFVRPGYPVKVVGSRSVLVEVLLGTDGNIKQAMVVGPPSGFDSAALQTARSWKFRPAKLEGMPVKSVVYLIFGYRMPV